MPLLLLLAGWAPPAVADAGKAVSPWYFFSQPGVAREQALADFTECRELAGVVQPPRADSMYSPGLVGAATTGFLQGMQRGEQRRSMASAAFRKCMAIKGYGRYVMREAEAKALYGGGWDAQLPRMADRALQPLAGEPRLDP